MTVIVGGAPLVALAVGSGLLTLADWRWVFGFLALSSKLAAAGFFGETYIALCLIMAASAILAFALALLSLRSAGRVS